MNTRRDEVAAATPPLHLAARIDPLPALAGDDNAAPHLPCVHLLLDESPMKTDELCPVLSGLASCGLNLYNGGHG